MATILFTIFGPFARVVTKGCRILHCQSQTESTCFRRPAGRPSMTKKNCLSGHFENSISPRLQSHSFQPWDCKSHPVQKSNWGAPRSSQSGQPGSFAAAIFRSASSLSSTCQPEGRRYRAPASWPRPIDPAVVPRRSIHLHQEVKGSIPAPSVRLEIPVQGKNVSHV